MKFTAIFLLNFLFLSILSAQQGFFLDDWQPKNFNVPAYIDTSYPDDAVSTHVTVNTADTITKVSKYVFGNNANVYSTIMYDNAILVNNLKNLNPHVLRYPGGNLSNEFFWDLAPGKPPQDVPQGQNIWYGRESWVMSVDNFYTLLDSVNCEGLITINYSYARYGTSMDPVAKAAHMAAEWVRYDNGRTRFWEIGNENFGNWEAGYEIDPEMNQDGQTAIISGDLYGQHAAVFIDSMKAAAAEIGHDIYIGVVAFEAETSWDAVQTDWNEGMLPHIANKTDYYVVHNYYTPYDQNSIASVILDSYSRTRDFISQVDEDVLDAGFQTKPVVLNEWNIFAVGSMQQVSHINGMHAALVLGESIKRGYGLTARWNLANGWDNGNDHGMFSRGDEPGVELFAPRPAFHHMTWFQRIFGDVMISSSIEDRLPIVTCYASTFHGGQAGIVLINRRSSEVTTGLEFLNYDLGERYYWYILEGGNDNGDFSRKVLINGHGPDDVVGGPENYDNIMAYSKQIVNDTVKISIPGYAVAYLVVEGQKSSSIPTKVENSQNRAPLFQVYPNPARSYININPGNFKYNRIIIYNILGQEVYSKTLGNISNEIKRLALNLTQGVYFIHLRSNNKVITQKVIIY